MGALMTMPSTSNLPVVKTPVPTASPVRLRCCGLSRSEPCDNAVRWKIDSNYYCNKDADKFWEDHFVDEHKVIRLMREEWNAQKKVKPRADLHEIV